MYASAVGTTVLQIKEIPPRPKEMDGILCLFRVAEGVDETAVRTALAHLPSHVGEIVKVTRVVGREEDITVQFTSHQAVLHVVMMAAKRQLANAELEVKATGERLAAVAKAPPQSHKPMGRSSRRQTAGDKAEDEARDAADKAEVTAEKARAEVRRVAEALTHPASLDVPQATDEMMNLCKGFGALYNNRPYDGRGWCAPRPAHVAERSEPLVGWRCPHHAMDAFVLRDTGVALRIASATSSWHDSLSIHGCLPRSEHCRQRCMPSAVTTLPCPL